MIKDILFTNVSDKKMDGSDLPEGYIPHPAFDVGGKKLYGIWVSKYVPTIQYDYTPETDQCYAPDFEGFNPDDTYIELYDRETGDFSDVQLSTLSNSQLSLINRDKQWYDYPNKIWANIKTTGNGIEAWWVWIPRYAYKMTGGVSEPQIIFINLQDKPIDKETYGETLPEGFIVHPAFKPSGTDGASNLKGIWVSKYIPTNK